ncbi:hypothetical protein HanIR_Chr14g0700391 [Helianthus annuus]|nr:hypothetical protein HanIR_Chr14g0700391 [Helianthus annuus]
MHVLRFCITSSVANNVIECGDCRLYMFGCFIKRCTRLKIESRYGLYVGVYVVT